MNDRCSLPVLAAAVALLMPGCAPRDAAVSDPPEASSPSPAPSNASVAEGTFGQLPGVEMLDRAGVEAFGLHGNTGAVQLSKIPVQGQPFEEALRIEIKEGSQNPWDVQLQTRTKHAVKKGDVMLATFHFRTEWVADESGEGQTEFVFELAREPWTKSISYPVRASRQWKKVSVPFVAGDSHPAGEAQVIFRLGYSPETIELAAVKLENFEKKLTLAQLPATQITYAGMEPTSAWRAAARERIEKHRKAELKVMVSDAAGNPVSRAKVSIELEQHQFKFGTCVVANKLSAPGHERYKAAVKSYFNTATIENSLKWVALDGDWGTGFSLDSAQRAIKWLREQRIGPRGHVLIWPGWRNLPRSLRAQENDPTELRRLVRAHIRDTATNTRGSLDHWDVMNEPFDNHDLIDILGKKEMIEWFKIARAADPDAKLYINDYAILSGGGGESPHREHYEETIRFLLDGGAPLDGIGLQGHFGTSLTSPEALLELLDRYAKFDKPLLVTEYDVVLDDEELAARYTEDFYTVLFSHPQVEGVIMWGFWDGAHWKKNAPMFREDWSLKPAGKAFLKLVQKRWHTQAQGETDPKGIFVLRGFLGQYQISVQHAGKTKTTTALLEPNGSALTVQMK